MAEQESKKGLNWEKAVFYAQEGNPKQAEKYLRVANVDAEDCFFLMINAYRNREQIYQDKAEESAKAGDVFATKDFLDRTYLAWDEAVHILTEAYRETRREDIDDETWEDIELAADEGDVCTTEMMLDYHGLDGEDYFKKIIHAYRNGFDNLDKAQYMAEKGRIEDTFDYLDKIKGDDWEVFNIAVEAFRNQEEWTVIGGCRWPLFFNEYFFQKAISGL